MGWVRGGVGSGWGGQGGCERKLKFLGRCTKKNSGGSGRGSGCWGGQGGCERRIEVFVKIQKKNWWEGGGVGSWGSVWGGSG